MLLLFVCSSAFSANGQKPNIVPNPSFEKYKRLPIFPNRNNSFEFETQSGTVPYKENTKAWFKATTSTPDLRILDDYENCKRSYKDCDKPLAGNNSVGIITYMKNDKTDTYREYIEVELETALHPNIEVFMEIWVVKERQAKLVSNNLGFYFSMEKVEVQTEEALNIVPQFNHDELINETKKEWVKISGKFTPKKPYKFLTIGNFFDNEKTKHAEFTAYNGSTYVPPYAYYLMDNVRVWQENIPEPEPEPIPEPEFDGIKLEVNKPIQLKNIFFETAKWELLPASFVELNKLYDLLIEYPNMEIAIHGHTDSRASDNYNLNLSKNRARSVFEWLGSKGIDLNRLQSEGFGENNPIDTNDTDEGRQNNRRVEFIILKK